MNQNEAENNLLNNSETSNKSGNDNKTKISNENVTLPQVVVTTKSSYSNQNVCAEGIPVVVDVSAATPQSVPLNHAQGNTIGDATLCLNVAKKDVSSKTILDETLAELKRVSSKDEQNCLPKDNVPSKEGISSPSVTSSAIIAVMTTTTTMTTTTNVAKSVASPITSPTAADVRQLHHVASAPVLNCVPLRTSQQQQKIKSYHDAKQTALWDTKSSMSSGGAILKSGVSSSTYSSPKMLRKASESSSCSNLPRRVSFPKSDNELVTGYLEPANPWEYVSTVSSVSEIADLYTKSCHKHNTRPLPDILEQLKAVELNKLPRQPILMLKKIHLRPGDCEALEEILKRVQFKCIDLSSCELEETAISAICDIIEYYEAANELNISTNPKGMTPRGWTSCAYMVGRSQELHVLNAEGNPISKNSAEHLGNALNTSNLHTVKLEHCGLTGAPLSGFCMKIRKNKTLKELWLAHNDLNCCDAESIADLLKVNHYLELVDISNNNIGDKGLKHIVEALIIQSKELERRSMFQRAPAIDDDIFSPIETTVDAEPSKLEQNIENQKPSDEIENTKSIENTDGKCIVNDNNSFANECSKSNSTSEVLIPDIDAFSIEMEAVPVEMTVLTSDETEAEDDTDDTVKSNTIKNKQQPCAGGGGQSMLDKLLSMNSDSSSEEGVSNLSTDTIAACGSDDISFVSDDIFDMGGATTTINTCTNSKVNTAVNNSTATITTTALPQSLTSETEIMSFGSLGEIVNDFFQKNRGAEDICHEKVILCDTCTIEANHCCECNVDKRKECMSSATLHCAHNNYNNKTSTNTNNNNNNPNTVQNQQNNLKETAHNQNILNVRTQHTNDENPHANADVFEVTAEESDCLVPCTSDNKPNALVLQNSTNAVDVNKNTRLAEDYDDTHSTDSAFESASEGDISRTLPEEFTRLSTSLESTRFEDIAKELAIETATIASESTEYLADTGAMSTTTTALTTATTSTVSTFTPNVIPLVKVGTQKSDEVKTKDFEVRFCETLLTKSNETSQNTGNSKANVENDSLLPKDTTESESVNCFKRSEVANSPIPTPPPPSTSPGGVGLSMRRTDSSCNFMTQSTRNHSQSSDSLCSDNSLDGSVSSDLNLSTSAQLNEKLTKNDTLSRQQRQCDTVFDCSNRAPSGLKALAIWNNNLTKEAGLYISDLLADTTSLDLLNIGKNCLSNEFVVSIKDSLTKNTTLTTLGLQSAHLSTKGIETLSSILAFGGNSTLQRIDIRDNKLEVESLTTLADALKSNTTVTQIDIDDEPKRLSVGSDAHLDYVRVVENVRSMCSRNEKTQSQMQAEKTTTAANGTRRRGGYYVGSRKISLTCHSRPLIEYSVAPAVTMSSATNKLEAKRKTGVRLRSPVPSPPTISPSSSPNRSRFTVFRVNEVSPLTSPSSSSAPTPTLSCSADSQQQNMVSLSSSLTTSTSLPSMATVTSSTQTIRRHTNSPRSRFHVSKIYEDPKVPLSKRSLPPITPPICLPPTPIMKSAPKNEIKDCLTQCPKEEKENFVQNEIILANVHKNDINAIDKKNPTEKAQSNRGSIPVFNENDITLTHNSANDIRLSNTDIPSLVLNDADKKEEVHILDNTINNTPTTQQIERKVSRIVNPTAVEKLRTLFQNPATIFQRSSSPEPKNVPINTGAATSESTSLASQAIPSTHQTQISIVQAPKQSPPTWSKLGSDMLLNVAVYDVEKTLTNEQPKSFLGAASKQLRDFGKQVFRQNLVSANDNNDPTSDNLLNIIPTVLSEANDMAARTNNKLGNTIVIKSISMDVKTEKEQTDTTTSSEIHLDKMSPTHYTQSVQAADDKIEISATIPSENINVSASDAD